MKGIIDTIVMILVIFLMMAVFLTAVTNESLARTRINLEELSIIRIANTFEYVNRAAGMAWYMGTVQAVFQVTDKSIGCGFDDELFTDVPEKYWYSYGGGPKSIKKFQAYFSMTEDERKKYNDFEPFVCYPSMKHLIEKIEEEFKPFIKS
ncbi:MAG: hypothetical protein HY518_04165, partial [Candidatus Aenigmarchaeota archaeon]|nr:hypothetical protein [Candidatus Aenigmarchaeota archaeon]